MERPPTDRPRLHRSRQERILFGVCGGLAEYFDLDPTLVRIAFVLVSLFPPTSAFGIFGYLLLAAIVPEAGSEHIAGRERLRHNLDGLRSEVSDLADSVRARVTGEPRVIAPRSGSETIVRPPAETSTIPVEPYEVRPEREDTATPRSTSDDPARRQSTVH